MDWVKFFSHLSIVLMAIMLMPALGLAETSVNTVSQLETDLAQSSISYDIDLSGKSIDDHKEVIIRMEPHEFEEFEGPVVQSEEKNSQDVVSSLKAHSQKTQENVKELVKDRGEVKNSFWISNAVLAEVPIKSLETIGEHPNVEQVHENYEVEIQNSEEEEYYQVSDYETSSNGDYTWGLERLDVDKLHDQGITGSDVRVAVSDTGVDIDHPDIDLYTADGDNDTYPGGWIEFDDKGNAVSSEPHDPDGHGTHVSGTVAGSDESGTQIGVAPDSDLMHAKIFDDDGNAAGVMAAIQWKVEPHFPNGTSIHSEYDEYNEGDLQADIASMSWGASGYLEDDEELISNLVNAGIMPIVAIGNNGHETVTSPGAIEDSIAIGASTPETTITYQDGEVEYEKDDIATFSSGDIVDEDYHGDSELEYIKPDFAAPGVEVLSAVPGGYEENLGTSMATPHIAGVAALILEEEGENFTINEVEDRLENSVDFYEEEGKTLDDGEDKNTRYGYGIVNAKKATTDFFEVEITNFEPADDSTEIQEGDTVKVEVNVENTGQKEGTQTIRLYDFSDNQVDSQEVTIGSDSSKTITLEWKTEDGDAGTDDIRVESDDNEDTEPITIEATDGAYFEITVEESDYEDEIVEDEDFTVSYKVENIGDTEDSQNIEFTVNEDGGEQFSDSKEVTNLGTDETHEGEFAWSQQENEPGDFNFIVDSENDVYSSEFRVLGKHDVTVDVTDGDGENLEDATLRVTDDEKILETKKTGENGEAVFSDLVEDQLYYVDLGKVGHEIRIGENFTVDPDDLTESLVTEEVEGLDTETTVLDQEEEPLENFETTITVPVEDSRGLTLIGDTRKTNEEGKVVFQDLDQEIDHYQFTGEHERHASLNWGAPADPNIETYNQTLVTYELFNDGESLTQAFDLAVDDGSEADEDGFEENNTYEDIGTALGETSDEDQDSILVYTNTNDAFSVNTDSVDIVARDNGERIDLNNATDPISIESKGVTLQGFSLEINEKIIQVSGDNTVLSQNEFILDDETGSPVTIETQNGNNIDSLEIAQNDFQTWGDHALELLASNGDFGANININKNNFDDRDNEEIINLLENTDGGFTEEVDLTNNWWGTEEPNFGEIIASENEIEYDYSPWLSSSYPEGENIYEVEFNVVEENDGGTEVEDAVVEIEQDGKLIEQGRTDASGFIDFVLDEGDYKYNVYRHSYDIIENQSVKLDEANDVSLEEATKFDLTVQVENSDGETVAENVEVEITEPLGQMEPETITVEDGSHDINMYNWKYDLEAIRDGDIGQETVDLNETKETTITLVEYFSAGTGEPNSEFEIETWKHLDNIREKPTSNFVLIDNLDEDSEGYVDFAGSEANDGKGWKPIDFEGTLDGNSNTIEKLYIERPEEVFVGFFSFSEGDISNLEVKNANVTGYQQDEEEASAIVAAINYGEIEATDVSGEVHGANAGGIAGINFEDSLITGSTAQVNITAEAGSSTAGGITAFNDGEIKDSGYEGDIEAYANDEEGFTAAGGITASNEETGVVDSVYSKGEIKGETNSGGIVGINLGEIKNSYSTMEIEGDFTLGGIAAQSDGPIRKTFYNGSITGNQIIGGITGSNDGVIEESYSTGSLEGENDIGGITGMMGVEGDGGDISDSYSATRIRGESETSALIGQHEDGTIGSNYWDMNASLQEEAVGNKDDEGFGQLEGLHQDSMTGEDADAAENMSELDFENTWETTTRENGDVYFEDGYPHLEWQIEETHQYPDPEPHIETFSPSIEDYSTVKLSGELKYIGAEDSMDLNFSYREDGETDWNEEQVIENAEEEQEFELTMDKEDFNWNTEYEFRAVAEGEDFDAEGDIKTFNVETPQVETLGYSDIGLEEAFVEGNLTDMGRQDELDGEVSPLIQWKKEDEDNWNTETLGISISEEGILFDETLGLDNRTEYEFRAAVEFEEDGDTYSVYGSKQSFETGPHVETEGTDSVGEEEATLEGSVEKFVDHEINVYFRWREDGDDDWEETSEQSFQDSSQEDFNEEIDSLSEDTEYEFKTVMTWEDPQDEDTDYEITGGTEDFTTDEEDEDEEDDEENGAGGAPPGDEEDDEDEDDSDEEEFDEEELLDTDEGGSQEIGFEDSPVTSVNIQASDGEILVGEVKSRSSDERPDSASEDPDGSVYRYMEYETDIDSGSISNVEFSFEVSKDWIEDQNIANETVSLNRYENGWEKLDTTLEDEDEDNFYYSADREGFSTYSITGDEISSDIEVTELSMNTVEVDPGEEFEINITVENTGNRQGTQEINVEVGDQTLSSEFSLSPGDTDTESFTTSVQDSGTFTVTAGDQETDLNVRDVDEDSGFSWLIVLAFFLILIALLAIGLLYMGKEEKIEPYIGKLNNKIAELTGSEPEEAEEFEWDGFND